jgi:hypothetical protein
MALTPEAEQDLLRYKLATNPIVKLAQMAIAYEQAFAVYFPDPSREMAELASEVMDLCSVPYWISPGKDSITCTKCRKTSNNPNDVRYHYCGHCHLFLDAPPDPPAAA